MQWAASIIWFNTPLLCQTFRVVHRSRHIRSYLSDNSGSGRERSAVCVCVPVKTGIHLLVCGQGAGAITPTPPKEWERERRSRSIPDVCSARTRSEYDPKKNDPRILFDLKKWSVIRDPNYFFNPRSVIRTFFSMIRTCSDQFISHVLVSKNWFFMGFNF